MKLKISDCFISLSTLPPLLYCPDINALPQFSLEMKESLLFHLFKSLMFTRVARSKKDKFDHYQFQKGKIFEIEKKLRPDFLQKFVKITSFKVRFSSKMYFLLRFFQNMYTIFFKIKKRPKGQNILYLSKEISKKPF